MAEKHSSGLSPHKQLMAQMRRRRLIVNIGILFFALIGIGALIWVGISGWKMPETSRCTKTVPRQDIMLVGYDPPLFVPVTRHECVQWLVRDCAEGFRNWICSDWRPYP